MRKCKYTSIHSKNPLVFILSIYLSICNLIPVIWVCPWGVKELGLLSEGRGVCVGTVTRIVVCRIRSSSLRRSENSPAFGESSNFGLCPAINILPLIKNYQKKNKTNIFLTWHTTNVSDSDITAMFLSSASQGLHAKTSNM